MSSEAPVPAGHSGTPRHGGTPRRAFPVRASDLLKVRAVWILPLVLGSVVVVRKLTGNIDVSGYAATGW